MAAPADAIHAAKRADRIVLTGAPDPARLSWDEASLLDDWTPAVHRFLMRKYTPEHVLTTASPWRSIPTSPNAHLHTGLTQESPRPDFLYAPTLAANDSFALSTPASQPAAANDDDESAFLEHSIFAHDTLHSSQLAPAEHSFLTSFTSTPPQSTSSSFSSTILLPPLRLPQTITPLRALPSSSHLHRLAPQTLVVSLIAAILSILPPRTIRTRRGALRELVEVLVGDETASGFSVSFWLDHHQGRPDPLRERLRELRVRDVVVLENVALDVWRERVFGYGLRRSVQRNQTRVEVVARGGVDRWAGLEGVERVGLVKEWVGGLVGEGRGGEAEEGDGLPRDTQ